MKKFEPHVCECCRQTTEYDLGLDRGSALIVIAVMNAVHRLGRNRVHIADEMLSTDGSARLSEIVANGYMTHTMVNNVSRARAHGLIAFADHKGGGEYLVTRKGADFLRGRPVWKTAIVSKAESHTTGYYEPAGETTVFKALGKQQPMWEGSLNNARSYLSQEQITMPLFPIH